MNIRVLPSKPASYFVAVMKDAIKEREAHNIVRPDMIHLLLEARKTGITNEEENEDTVTERKQVRKLEISDDDIASQAMIFFLAGFETVSSSICFTLYELAVNPDVQRKLRDEIDETFQENGKKLTYDVIVKMKYIDMVISGW